MTLTVPPELTDAWMEKRPTVEGRLESKHNLEAKMLAIAPLAPKFRLEVGGGPLGSAAYTPRWPGPVAPTTVRLPITPTASGGTKYCPAIRIVSSSPSCMGAW